MGREEGISMIIGSDALPNVDIRDMVTKELSLQGVTTLSPPKTSAQKFTLFF